LRNAVFWDITQSIKKFACRWLRADFFIGVPFDPEDRGSTLFRTYLDFYEATRRHIPGDTAAHNRRCEIQQFSLCSLRHATVLRTLAVVGVVTHGHKICMERNVTLAENRNKTLNFFKKCRINTT
jgi:hypothetical protein